MTAQEKLSNRINKGYHICVGLDTDITKIPKHLLNSKNPITDFNEIIIESTFEHAAAFKINFAFYEKDGTKGFENISELIEKFPSEEILLIADAKRGDIGNTSKMYAQSIFDYFNFDAVTLHPYMGYDSLEPFFQYHDKLNFVLALTSNPGAQDFEKVKLSNNEYLYQKVIRSVNEWNVNNNCGLVFGATNLSELIDNITLFNDMPILLPGIGAQGGSLEEVTKVFKNHNKKTFLINLSRSLIYFDTTKEFASKISDEIKRLNFMIQGEV